MTALVPRLRPARVTVVLTDGRTASLACDSHRGDFQQPFAESELRDKFRELGGVRADTGRSEIGRASGRSLRRVGRCRRADDAMPPPRSPMSALCDQQRLGAGVEDGVGVDPVFVIQIRDIAALAEMVRPKWNHALAAHAPSQACVAG